MPITKRQFELGIDDEIELLMVKLYEYLDAHRDVAFSASELMDSVGKGDYSDITFRNALEALNRAQAVDSRWVREQTYYAFSNDVDVKTWELKIPDIPVTRF